MELVSDAGGSSRRDLFVSHFLFLFSSAYVTLYFSFLSRHAPTHLFSSPRAALLLLVYSRLADADSVDAHTSIQGRWNGVSQLDSNIIQVNKQ